MTLMLAEQLGQLGAWPESSWVTDEGIRSFARAKELGETGIVGSAQDDTTPHDHGDIRNAADFQGPEQFLG